MCAISSLGLVKCIKLCCMVDGRRVGNEGSICCVRYVFSSKIIICSFRLRLVFIKCPDSHTFPCEKLIASHCVLTRDFFKFEKTEGREMILLSIERTALHLTRLFCSTEIGDIGSEKQQSTRSNSNRTIQLDRAAYFGFVQE